MGNERRAQQQARTREELLDAAVEVFGAAGFDRASVDAIAKTAGYTKGAVYANFASKEELFLAMIDRRMELQRSAPHLQTRADEPGASDLRDDAERLDEFLRNAFDLDWALLATETLLYAVRHSPELRQSLAVRYRQLDDATRAVLETKRPEHPDADDLAVAHSALGEGLMLRRLLDPEAFPPERLGRIFDMVFGDPEP